jgi:hypothetical protein
MRLLLMHILTCAALTAPCLNQPMDMGPGVAPQEPPASGEVNFAIRVERLKVNSRESDFAPYVKNGKLYFVSDRSNRMAVQYSDERDQTTITDIYSVTITGHSTASKAGPLPKPINSEYHEGPICIDNSERLYYSTNQRKGGEQQIFSCNSTSLATPPVQLNLRENNETSCHPALSMSGDSLVFSSANSENKMDLFLSVRSNGNWQKGMSFGKQINSPANELFPFISGNTLYFSSDRPGGKGGLDIYSVDLNSGIVQPLPEPINSAADDFGIWTDTSASRGYFSTNRNPVYKDDVYYFETDIPDFSAARTPTVKYTFCYTFFEEASMQSADTAEMTYEWNFGDGTKARGLRTRHCFTGPGTYPVSLNVVEKVSGEVFSSHVRYDLEIPEPEKLYIHCPDSAGISHPVQFSSANSAIAGYRIDRIFWSFGDGWYNRGATTSHIYGKTGMYEVGLWILATNSFSGKQEKFKTTRTVAIVDKLNQHE